MTLKARNAGKLNILWNSQVAYWSNMKTFGIVRGRCSQETAKHHAKFGWPPLSDVGAVTLPRREIRWNLLGCPKLANWSQPLVGLSSSYWKNVWRRYCCLTSFFPIFDTCLSCKDIDRQSCAMVHRWRFFGQFLHPVFPESRVQHISHLHAKFTLRPHHVWNPSVLVAISKAMWAVKLCSNKILQLLSGGSAG